MLNLTKKHIPCSRAKRKSQQDGRKGRIHLESNLIPPRDAWRVQTKHCVHQDPGKGAVTTRGDGGRPAFECLSVSCRGTGQQWPATGTGALAAADLEARRVAYVVLEEVAISATIEPPSR